MATNAPAKAKPNVQHNFEGDANVLIATVDRRTEIRKALAALAQDLQRIEGSPARVQAEIKFQTGGTAPKEHVYMVTVTNSGFDATDFFRDIPGGPGSISAPSPPMHMVRSNGQHASPSRAESLRAEGDDDVVWTRPFKRQKPNAEKGSIQSFRQQSPVSMAQTHTPAGSDETLAFLRTWHDEWTRQGGWLFDTLSKTSTAVNGIRESVEKKMESVQDILGQSINASSASTIAELGNVTTLIHWLEHCRKTSADKVQAREEKWRSSSATFHDSARHEREAAEKRLEKKLDDQNELLRKLARANNIEIGAEIDQQSAGGDGLSRDASLGAQLTAELNN